MVGVGNGHETTQLKPRQFVDGGYQYSYVFGRTATFTGLHVDIDLQAHLQGRQMRGPLLAQTLGDFQSVDAVDPIEMLGDQAGLVALDRADAVPLQGHVSGVRQLTQYCDLLHRLLDAMFSHGVGFVTTSNFKPNDLYPDGLHRDRILPAIALLNEKLEVVHMDNGTDYRQQTLEQANLYHTPLTPSVTLAMSDTFVRLAECADQDPVLRIESRVVRALRRAGGVAWFDFKTLCGGARSQNDYLELASQFHTIFLSDVPQMPMRMASEARRFTWLIDVLYDRRVKLIMSAEVAPELLYLQGPLSHEFPRTVSRLQEMQSSEYLAMERRLVDTALT